VITKEQFKADIDQATAAASRYQQMNASIRGIQGGYITLQELSQYLKIEVNERNIVLDSVSGYTLCLDKFDQEGMTTAADRGENRIRD